MKGVWAPLLKMSVFTVVTALATVMIGFTIANVTFTPTNTYSATFADATNLLEGSDVRISGVIVGTVESVGIVDRRYAEVRFSVQRGTKLPASSIASIRYQNLIGQRYLAIEPGPGPTEQTLPPGGSIPLQRTNPALNLTVLFNGFKPLFQGLDPQQINKLSFEIIQVLQGEGGTVESLVASTASLTNSIADKDRVIGEVITNLNQVLDTVNARDQQLSALIKQLQQLMSGFAADREPIGEAIVALNELTESTAGLVGQAREPLRRDIAALRELAGNLNDSEELIEQDIQVLPEKLNTITRTGSYGSWFNFYLCATEVTLKLPPGVPEPDQPLPMYRNDAARCSA
jgi:phospholipid/cholesterol/gamma-HCH transport system substrate-binding protein